MSRGRRVSFYARVEHVRQVAAWLRERYRPMTILESEVYGEQNMIFAEVVSKWLTEQADAARRFRRRPIGIILPPRALAWLSRNLPDNGARFIVRSPFSTISGAARRSIPRRSPATGLAIMSTSTGSSSYGEARDAGLPMSRALAYGVSQGTIEGATEKLPMEFITKSLGKVKMTKFLGEFVAKEMAGEQVATVLQDMNTWHALNPDKTMGEYLRERPARAAETAIATLVNAGAMGAMHMASRGR